MVNYSKQRSYGPQWSLAAMRFIGGNAIHWPQYNSVVQHDFIGNARQEAKDNKLARKRRVGKKSDGRKTATTLKYNFTAM